MLDNLLKRLAAQLPDAWQTSLRCRNYARQIRRGGFTHSDPEFSRMSEWIRPGDTVLDLGANLGIYTARMSELAGPTGRVFAFEPIPGTFELLTRNAAHFAHPNVTLLNVAASDTFEIAGATVPRLANGLPDIYCAGIKDGTGNLPVFTLPGDALTYPSRVSVVKIDVEGHEYRALHGLENTLREHRPVVLVEGCDAPVKQFLESLNYRPEWLPKSPNTIFWPESVRLPRAD